MLPLVFSYDLKKIMKVHFLIESDIESAGSELNLLKSYLNLVKIDIDSSDIIPPNSDSDVKESNRKVGVLCCFLDRSTEKPSKSGLSIYVDYLNEMMTNTAALSARQRPETSSPPSYYEFRASQEQQQQKLPVEVYSSPKCTTPDCYQVPLDDRAKYYGMCYNCFHKHVSIFEYLNTKIEFD